MIKKLNFAALVVTVSLMTVSCNQQEDNIDTGGAKKTATFKVSINKAGASTRLNGGVEEGVEDENKISDNWVAFAVKGTRYRAFRSTEVGGAPADGNGYNNVAELRDVAASQRIYVIANPYDMTVDNGGPRWDDFIQRTDIMESEIMDLVSHYTKSQINAFSTALQAAVVADPAAPRPSFGGNAMLMSGVAIPPPDADANSQIAPVEVKISLEREFSKVELIVDNRPGDNLRPGGSSPATIVSIDNVSIHRLRPKIYPFVIERNGGPDMDDTNYLDNVNNNVPSTAATTFSYTYDFTTAPVVGSTDGKAYFYVTPNAANLVARATPIVVRATLRADFTGQGEEELSRFFKVYIADRDVAQWATYKNTIYKITARINSWGHEDTPSALDGKADLDVKVELKRWSVRNVQVDFE